MNNDYIYTLATTATPATVFAAITENVDQWWTNTANSAKEIDELMKVEFGDNTYKVMKVIESIPNQSLVWHVIEAHIGHEELEKKDEWVGTTIHWKITPQAQGSEISISHQGLNESMECWEVCSNGWNYFLGSLGAFLNTGNGTPFINNK